MYVYVKQAISVYYVYEFNTYNLLLHNFLHDFCSCFTRLLATAPASPRRLDGSRIGRAERSRAGSRAQVGCRNDAGSARLVSDQRLSWELLGRFFGLGAGSGCLVRVPLGSFGWVPLVGWLVTLA